MIYLGIDLSVNRTGWFVFQDKDMKVLDYGAIEPNKSMEEVDKLMLVYSTIDSVCKRYHPDGCGIEKEFSGTNAQTVLKLGHFHGALMLALKQNFVPFTYYSVMTLKTQTVPDLQVSVNGKRKTGKELKLEVQEQILNIFGERQFPKPYDTDETDAASAAYVYYKVKGIDIEKMKKDTEKANKKRRKSKSKK